MDRKINIILIVLATIVLMYNCKSLSAARYDKAYEVVYREGAYFKEYYIKCCGKDFSRIYIYDSVYAVNDSSYYSKMESEKGGKPLYRDLYLSKLSKKYYDKENWLPVSELKKIYDKRVFVFYKLDSLIGRPLNTVVFSPIENNVLRADVIPFYIKKPLYWGSVRKYYFKFEGRKIIQEDEWTDYYTDPPIYYDPAKQN